MSEIEGPVPVRHEGQGGNRQRSPARAYQQTVRRASKRTEPADAVSILGLDPRAFTPEMHQVVATLMDEIDDLRAELDQAHVHLEQAEAAADQDDLLAVLNRHAFVRRLRGYLDHQRQAQVPACLMMIHMANFDQVHRRFGLPTGLQALRELARRVAHALRTTDVLGASGGAGLIAILPGAGELPAMAKLERLLREVQSNPFPIDGARVQVRVVGALRALHPDDEPETALDEVDEMIRVQF